MNLAEMATEVYTITNRPDLVAETSAALRKATIKMHSLDFFPRDMAEVTLAVPTPGNNVQVDIGVTLTRFRALAYVRDNTSPQLNGLPNKIFRQIEARELLDEYSLEKSNVWYLGGQVINIKSSTPVSSLLIGYYQNPVINPAGSYSSWIAVEQPFVLIEEAAATIFAMTGNAEMARFYMQQSVANAALLRQNYLEGVAR